MLARIAYLLNIATIAAVLVTSADARQRHAIDATPFSHAPCSVLDGRPCTPSFCGVFNHGPCIPEIDYPTGENLQLNIESQPTQNDAARYSRPEHALDTIGDLFAAMRSCWTPPPADDAREGMQMSVRFSFKRSGEVIGLPRVTYATSGVAQNTRETYRKAIVSSLDSCLPLKFTTGLGGAIAGRPIAIRYIDNRRLGAQSATP